MHACLQKCNEIEYIFNMQYLLQHFSGAHKTISEGVTCMASHVCLLIVSAGQDAGPCIQEKVA